jgi:general secretion pathway protein A
MYESYFNLKERPYSISPDPRFIYLTAQHQEALAKCQYAIAQKMGISAIYGNIGAGKTSLARRLWEQYGADPMVNFAMLVHPNYPSPFQFLREIRREFGLDKPRRSLTELLNEFHDFLLNEHRQGKTNVLVVDEAQYLRPPLFETLRHLLNYETNTEKLLQIVLFGQNELAMKIDRMPELKDRIMIFGALSSMTRDDVSAIIDFRWRVAGGTTHPFEQGALDAIFRYSQGSPRKACKLCDNALIRAYSAELTVVDRGIIDHVAQEVRLASEESPAPARPGRKKKEPLQEVTTDMTEEAPNGVVEEIAVNS